MSQFVFPPLTATLASEATKGGSLPAKQIVIAGYDGANVRVIKTDAAGELQVDIASSALPSGAATSALQTAGNNLLTTIDADTSLLSGAVKNIQSAQGTTDAGFPALVVRNDTLADLSGADGDYTPLQVNATGALYVAVNSSALPTGAATEAKQDVIETTLNSIEGDTSSLAGAVSGTEIQVDVVASLPAGSNNIGDVDVLSVIPGVGATNLGKAIQSAQGTTDTGVPALVVRNDTLADLSGADGDYSPLQVNATGALYTTVDSSALPTGAATSALQTAGNNLLTTIDADTSALAGAVSGTEVQVDVVASLPAGSNKIGDVDVLSLPADSKNYVWKEGLDSTIGGITNSILDTSSTNIPSGSQLTVATLSNDIYEIQTVEDIGEFIGIYAGSTLKAILPLGGGSVKINLPSTTVVKLASFSGTAISSGKIAINFLG